MGFHGQQRRVDQNARGLIRMARQCGAQYLPLNSTIDGLLLYQGRVHLVDWKMAGATLTPDQAKLVAAGWPIRFISDEQQLIQVIRG